MESAITINPSGLNLVYSRYTTGRHGITYTCRSAMICRDDRELFFLHFSVFIKTFFTLLTVTTEAALIADHHATVSQSKITPFTLSIKKH